MRKTRKLRILVTAGPTREPIDPVRYLTNRSSGKMGYALAAAARKFGRVTLVTGPVVLRQPQGVKLIRVGTAAEMARAVLREGRRADLVVQCAAVADYTAAPRSSKIKRRGPLTLRLRPTLDIAAALGRRKRPGQILVGFAAETSSLERNALKKLRAKNLDFIVANRVGKQIAFDSDYNEATVFGSNGAARHFKRQTKRQLAMRLLRIFAQ